MVPMMTAAKPNTICPVPIVALKERPSWQTMHPESATSALAMTSPRIFIRPLSTARVVTRVSLSPTARSSRPFLVEKYHSSTSPMSTTSTSETMSLRYKSGTLPSSAITGAEV